MKQDRRKFLKTLSSTGLLLGTGTFPLLSFTKPELIKLTILHTNDVHSRVEPFPMDGGRLQGLGGAARRAKLIEQIRSEEEHVLLLDSGDIFQGTPYFNYFGGELEFKLMSEMRYDAATLGNHDFDAGLDGLHKQLPHANFSLISSNYDFSDTLMHDKVKPYQIFRKGGLKIGIFGIGIELEGLVPSVLYGNTLYLDPIKKANEYATLLKQDEQCDYVICLSHLGYQYDPPSSGEAKVSDVILAENTRHIDLIIGGHTHTFMDRPDIRPNADNQEVHITQAGWAGIVLGRLDVYFERNKKRKCVICKSQLVNGQ